MNEKPLVSIVTPVLNGAKYLKHCLDNVLGQKYSNIEHVLVDGGSTDSSLDIISAYQKIYPTRINLVLEPGSGVGEALNAGFKTAKGDIFGWLDSDDLYETNAVETAVRFFLSNREAFYIYGGDNIINEKGEIIGKLETREYNFMRIVCGVDYVPWANAFFRREVVEKVGYFNSLGNNLDFWIRVANNFEMFFIPETLHNWRLHQEQIGLSRDPSKLSAIGEKLRQDYELCKRYGGGNMAPRCKKYYMFVILNKIGLYNFANSLRYKARQYYPIKKITKLLGTP